MVRVWTTTMRRTTAVHSESNVATTIGILTDDVVLPTFRGNAVLPKRGEDASPIRPPFTKCPNDSTKSLRPAILRTEETMPPSWPPRSAKPIGDTWTRTTRRNTPGRDIQSRHGGEAFLKMEATEGRIRPPFLPSDDVPTKNDVLHRSRNRPEKVAWNLTSKMTDVPDLVPQSSKDAPRVLVDPASETTMTTSPQSPKPPSTLTESWDFLLRRLRERFTIPTNEK